MDQLHENDQLHWEFTDYDAAMNELKSGRAYAAYVDVYKRQPLDYRELVMLAIATSIDALAVGITFAFLGAVSYTHLAPTISSACCPAATTSRSTRTRAT